MIPNLQRLAPLSLCLIAMACGASEEPQRSAVDAENSVEVAPPRHVKYPLSPRNLEDLLAERGIDIGHETVRL